jgi:hypothetical protein
MGITHNIFYEGRNNMKRRVILGVLAAGMVVSMVSMLAFAGNGAPNGSHFTLNIIGVQNDKNGNKDGGGSVIFVPLDTTGRTSRTGVANKVDILLQPGDNFYVIDGDATNDDTAIFQMPTDVATTYTVWARGLGKPTGNADMRLWAYDEETDTWIAAAGQVTIQGHSVNGAPKQKFVNVTDELFILANGDSVFDPDYEQFLWTYGNNGQKLVQLRFYPVSGDN